MSKFNTTSTRPARGRGPVGVTSAAPTTVTHEGGPAYVRDVKSELFMLAVVNFVGEDTFYETAEERDARFVTLVRNVAVADVEWLTGLVGWLRNKANLRSASIVAACQGVHARMAAGLHGGNRMLIDSAMARADEPGELFAYWTSQFGRALPMPVKRGLADAAKLLYDEFALLRYDTRSHEVRFADVIELAHVTATHPSIKGTWQGDLFQYALDRRHGRDVTIPGSLRMVTAQADLRRQGEADPGVWLDTHRLREAGLTWEDALPRVEGRVPVAKVWEALIPTMGIMALARNLRNFDEAGVSDEAAQKVIDRFGNAEHVARSRMFPFRWLSAYETAPSLRWGHALDQALQHSLAGLPALPGRTLILVDTSASMTGTGYSRKSKVTPLKAAAVFGVALAAKGERVDLVGFADGHRPFRHDIPKGASVVREVDRFVDRCGEDGHGTEIAESLRKTYAGHDRVVIVSDMQTMDGHGRGVSQMAPAHVPIYGFNLGGYRATPLPAGTTNRYEFGGLTDATFRMIPLIERGKSASWPWLEAATS